MNEEFDYTPDLVSVSDDDGNEYNFEVLDRIETDDGRYVAVVEYFDDPQEMLMNDSEVIILKVAEENGETYLTQIDDEEVYAEVSDLFEERLANLYEDEGSDEGDA